LLADAEHYGGNHHDGGDFHGFLLLPAPGWRRTVCCSDAAARKKVARVASRPELLRRRIEDIGADAPNGSHAAASRFRERLQRYSYTSSSLASASAASAA
jgi:hypothetical protein